MTRGEWILVGLAVLVWIWFLRQMFSPYGFFDKPRRVCFGCQRHRLIPGCSVHDPQARKATG